MIGDMAEPVNSFDVSISFDQSLRHFNVPVAASNERQHGADPEREDRPPATSGVENGPFDIMVGVLVLGERGRVARVQIGSPLSSSNAETTSSGSLRLSTNTRPSSTTGTSTPPQRLTPAGPTACRATRPARTPPGTTPSRAGPRHCGHWP